MAGKACELTKHARPQSLKILAAAHAEIGRFPEAIATIQEAQQLAANTGNKDLARECQLMLENFQSAKPWR